MNGGTLRITGTSDTGTARGITLGVNGGGFEIASAANSYSVSAVVGGNDGKLIKLEGDFDHVVNEGSLCVKGMAMFPTHASPLRNQTPRYRAPGVNRRRPAPPARGQTSTHHMTRHCASMRTPCEKAT